MHIRKYFIYKITNLINGKIYIGRTFGKSGVLGRFGIHKCHALNGYSPKIGNSYIGRAIRKYGKENFKVETLLECFSFQEMREAEVRLIKENQSHLSSIGYNLVIENPYGDGLEYISEETKKKMAYGKHKNRKQNIYWDRFRNKWAIRISLNGKIYAKRFENQDEAESYSVKLQDYLYNGNESLFGELESVFFKKREKKNPFKGVYNTKDGYHARIKINLNKSDRTYLGCFTNIEEAILCHDKYCFAIHEREDLINDIKNIDLTKMGQYRKELKSLLRKIAKNNNFRKKTSPYLFVQLHNKKWRYNFVINGIKYTKGRFLTDREAHEACQKHRQEILELSTMNLV